MTLRAFAAAALLALALASFAQTAPKPAPVQPAENGPPYVVSGWSMGAQASLDAAAQQGALDEVDLDWFVSKKSGAVKGEEESPLFVASLRGSGQHPLATVSNWSNRKNAFDPAVPGAILASRHKRAKQVEALVRLCLEHGYDGIDLDWEALKAEDRDRFSDFVEELAKALHDRGLTLAVAVHPKTTEPGEAPGSKAEDWARLGAAADEFKVMTYDHSGSWSPPGPIAPPEWMDAVLAHAESLVPPRKIMMGLPFYGYDWSGGSASHVNWADVQKILAARHPNVTRDPSGEATFTYTDGRGARHTVYFQDRQAIQAKLAMLRQRHPGIRGVAVWLMEGEDPDFWTDVADALR